MRQGIRLAAALVITGLVVAAGLSLGAQAGRQTPAPAQPTFRGGVDLIHFDVSVLDKDRHPVRGLTAADFTVLEDGRPQPIAAFSEVDVPPPAPPPPAKWMREVSPDIQTNQIEQNPEGRLFVIFIDDALIPADLWALKSAKKIAHGVVDRLSPTDQAAVVFSFLSRNSQDFTTDRKKLGTAIDSAQIGTSSHVLGWDTAMPGGGRSAVVAPVADGDAGLRQGSLRTLHEIADTLIAAPQRRKALIFVSPGVTVDRSEDAIPVRGGIGPGVAIREANHQLATEMPEVLRRMQTANVTIYSVDPCGFGGLEAYILQAASGLPALKKSTEPPPPFYNWLAPSGPPTTYALAHHAATLDMDFLMAAAANTGGHAIVNTNDFDPGLDGIFAENGSYYLLAYRMPDKNAAGSLHRLTVKVNRPGVTVRTQSGYEMPAPDKPDKLDGKKAPPSPASKAIAGPVPSADVPLQVSVAPVAVAGREEPAVTVVLGLRQPSVTTRTAQKIDLQVSPATPDGRLVGRALQQTVTLTLVPASAGSETRYELLTQVALKPGRYQLRIGAHRSTDDVSGSVYADVDVPDFAKAPLSLSGVWLEATPGVTAVPSDAFFGLLPLRPTASREFRTTDKVVAFFRVYEGGVGPLVPVEMKVRILNDHDAAIADVGGTIGIDRFTTGTRAADHRFALPLATFAPGAYLLTFEAALEKTTVRRDVRFVVR